MRFTRDFFNNPVVPGYILTKADKERIGIIKCASKTLDVKYRATDEITFTTYMKMNDEMNPYYDAIDVMKYILLPEYGFFFISNCTIHSEGTDYEYKEIKAKSYEYLLGQKYIENFVINKGTTESIDSVVFYDFINKERSLMSLILEKCPDWKMGHVDSALMTMQRSFEIDRQDIYSFLMNDVSTAFECVFLFDALSNTINVYQEKNIGKDTNIHVSYNNLLKNTELSCNTDDIKTCLTVIGADDLTLREVNMSQDKIYDFSYYNSTEYMSEGLYRAYNAWIVLYNRYSQNYSSLLSDYQNYYVRINYLKNLKMPDDLTNTDWTLYGLVPLQEQLAAYEQRQAVMMKSGWGEPSSSYYSTSYLPVYNTIQAINSQISVVQSELKTLESEQSEIYERMQEITSLVSMENNFTEDELAELSAFIHEDELSSDNYIVTESMTDEERFEMLEDMLEYGRNELAKVSTPQLTFSADMANIFAMPEFDSLVDDFDISNYIWVTLRDDYHIKARLLEIHLNFYEPDDFSVSFGNVLKKKKNLYTDVTNLLKEVQSVSTSVSFNKSNWDKANKDATFINQMLADGLLAQGNYITNNPDDSEMLIDKRGIFINTITGDYAYKDSIFLGGGRILFTDDGWKTVAMAVGRAEIKGESRFGVFADFCIASYIAGSTMEGGTITGTEFNNGSGTFKVTADGILTASKATIVGDITANKGYIGGTNGFTIESGKLYSGKSILTDNSDGVYIGIDGIALGADSIFKVDKNGNLTAVSATITGTITASIITGSSINNGNGTFSVDEDGNLVATSVDIKGKISSSEITSSSINNGNGTFKVDRDGNVTATSATITGTISSSTITSTSINNGNGTFLVDANGNLTATSVTVKGKIQATEGYIGGSSGFTITTNKLYNGKSTVTSTSNGVYIGTDGIALGAGSIFYVDNKGNLTATSATIKGKIQATEGYIGGTNGFTIKDGCIYSGTKSAFSSTNSGVYIGTDGISLGSNFSSDTNGNLTISNAKVSGSITSNDINVTGGKIANFKIEGGYLTNGISIGNAKSCGISCGTSLLGHDDWIFWAGNGVFRVNIDGKLYASDVSITGGTLKVGDNFYVNEQGVLKAKGGIFESITVDANSEFKGVLNGATGNFSGAVTTSNIIATGGSIANFTISGGYLFNGISIGLPKSCGISCGTELLGDDNWIFWAGNGAFRVNINGDLYSTNLNVTGGSININNKFIVDNQGNVTLPSSATLSWGQVTGTDDIATKTYVGNQGYQTASQVTTITNDTIKTTNVVAENLTVKAANISGDITAKNLSAATGTIGQVTASNLTITGGSITIGSAFSVTNAGALTCTSANISGVLKAGTGSSIGGFSVDSNSLYSGTWGTTAPDVFISTGTSGTYTIAGRTASDWGFGAGGNFGVTTSGIAYCTDLNAYSLTLSSPGDGAVTLDPFGAYYGGSSTGWNDIIKAGNSIANGKASQNVYITTTAGNDYKLVFANGILVSCDPV